MKIDPLKMKIACNLKSLWRIPINECQYEFLLHYSSLNNEQKKKNI